MYDECGDYSVFTAAGKPILNAEYASSASEAQSLASTVCASAAAASTKTVIFPLDLDDAFRVSCN